MLSKSQTQKLLKTYEELFKEGKASIRPQRALGANQKAERRNLKVLKNFNAQKKLRDIKIV